MTDAQTDREHLQAVIEAAESYVGIGWDHANESDDLTSKIAAAKQHLDTTTPSPNESEIRADERRRIDELAEQLLDSADRNAVWVHQVVNAYGSMSGECFVLIGKSHPADATEPFDTFTEALAATQSIQAEAGGPENG